MINTKQVADRRTLRFENMHEILADAESLASQPCHLLGNWSLGQIFHHLSLPMVCCVQGFGDAKLALPMRVVGRLIKKQSLAKGFPAGVRFPKPLVPAFTPKPCSTEEGLAALREAIALLSTTDVRHPSPLFGAMTVADWEQMHLRHAELHLSFAVPEGE